MFSLLNEFRIYNKYGFFLKMILIIFLRKKEIKLLYLNQNYKKYKTLIWKFKWIKNYEKKLKEKKEIKEEKREK